MRGRNKLVPRLLGITRESIMRVDENTKEVLKTWPLTTVRRWAASPNSFTLVSGVIWCQLVSFGISVSCLISIVVLSGVCGIISSVNDVSSVIFGVNDVSSVMLSVNDVSSVMLSVNDVSSVMFGVNDLSGIMFGVNVVSSVMFGVNLVSVVSC